ncbi:MAG: hypothetical protein AAFV93_02235 [Chloroflexota bacterium]
MDNPQHPDWLGDDGEFKEPVDHRLGVYSPIRRGYYFWRYALAGVSLFGCSVALMWWMVQ